MAWRLRTTRNFRFLFVAFIILLIPAGYFYLYFVPAQQDYLTNRNLRQVNNIGEQLSRVVNGFKLNIDSQLLQSGLLIRPIGKDTGRRTEMLDNRIREIFSNINRIELESHRLNIEDVPPSGLKSDYQSRIDFSFDYVEDRYLIRGEYTAGHGQAVFLNLIFNAALDPLILPLIESEVFDNFMVLDNRNGAVVYQSNRSEYYTTRIDSLSADIPAQKRFSSTTGTLNIGNKAYAVFGQPLQIRAGNGGGQKNAGLDLYLVGLVSAQQFSADSRTIPTFWISLFFFTGIVILFAIPIIKLQMIGPLDELRRKDLVSAICAFFITSGLFTFLVLSVYTNIRHDEFVDGALKDLAGHIESRLTSEIRSLKRQYQVLHTSLLDAPAGIDEGELIQNDYRWSSILIKKQFPLPSLSDYAYPYFNQIAWIDKQGHQTLKLSPVWHLTPRVNVGRRMYFQSIHNKRSWNFNGVENVFIEPLVSFTTGALTSSLSFPALSPGGAPLDTELRKRIAGAEVVAISNRFQSLFETVLPKGFSFCIVNSAGDVLFHQQESKNLRENFLVECDNSRQLRSALFSRVAKGMNVRYHGNSYQIYVREMKSNAGWFMVTLANTSVIESPQQSALYLAMPLFAVLALLSTLIVFLFMYIRDADKLSWLWPSMSHYRHYRVAIILLSMIVVLCFLTLYQLNHEWSLPRAFFVPLLSILIVHATLQLSLNGLLRDRDISTDPNLPLMERTSLFLRTLLSDLLTILKRNPVRSALISILMGVIVFLCSPIDFFAVMWSIFILFFFLLVEYLLKVFFPKLQMIPGHFLRYLVCTTLLLLTSSILPSISLYQFAYNLETEAYYKSQHIDLVNKLERRRLTVENRSRAEQDVVEEARRGLAAGPDEQLESNPAIFIDSAEETASRLESLARRRKRSRSDIYTEFYNTVVIDLTGQQRVSELRRITRDFAPENAAQLDSLIGPGFFKIVSERDQWIQTNDRDSTSIIQLYDATLAFLNKSIDHPQATYRGDFILSTVYRSAYWIANLLQSAFSNQPLESGEVYNLVLQNPYLSWYRTHETGMRDHLVFKQLSADKNDEPTYVFVSAIPWMRPPVFLPIEDKREWVAWFASITLLVCLLFLTLLFLIRRIFYIDLIYPPEIDKSSAGEGGMSGSEPLINQETMEPHIVLLGLPNTGKSRFLYDEFTAKNQHNQMAFFDLKSDAELDSLESILGKAVSEEVADSDLPRLFIIDHFDILAADKERNQRKLLIVEKLVEKLRRKVIIISTINPAKNVSADAAEAQRNGGFLIDKKHFSQWLLQFSSFTKVYHKMRPSASAYRSFAEKIDKIMSIRQFVPQQDSILKFFTAMYDRGRLLIGLKPSGPGNSRSLADVIKEECKTTPFLRNVGLELAQRFDIDNRVPVETVEKLIVEELYYRSEAYYNSIWETCTPAEKITLYHVARNGLVSPRDIETVRTLERKGLISRRRNFRLFNESFRIFVTASEINRQMSAWKSTRSNNWTQIQNVLIPLLFAAAAFIFITQRSTFNEGYALLSALVSLIPLIIKLLGTFPSARKKEDTASLAPEIAEALEI